MNKLCKFYGLIRYDGVTDPNEFVRMFKLKSLICDWDEKKQASVISYLLTHKAEQAYNLLTEDDKKSINKVFDQLMDKCKISTEIYFNEFNNRKLKVNETYSQFAFALQELLDKAFSNLGVNEKSMLLKNKLCDHLPEHMKCLRFDTSKTCDDIIACFEEDSLRGKWFEMYGNDRDEVNAGAHNCKRFNGVCFYCGIFGHHINNCYKLQRKK